MLQRLQGEPRLSPAASAPDLDLSLVQGDVDLASLHLDPVGGYWLYGWQALCLAALHVEARPVQRALYLFLAIELAVGEMCELVGAYIFEGVKLAADVAQADRAPFELELL